MLQKAKLVKKQTLEKMRSAQNPKVANEKQDRVQLTERFVQTTKDWLVSRRQQQTNARQAFAALFMNADTQSNAI